ncbi:MAG: hypothetical protein AMXMBFR58_05650 [Phycisphaerae bacterium]|nr:hypothetical protein [Phycisphaerales bacterium]MCK6476734.1 DMT family transporter [Phycisphaerales bacterium]
MHKSSWFIHGIQILLALSVGLATACQPAINAKFAQYTPSRLYGGLLNFAVGLLAMVVVFLTVRVPVASPQQVAQAPWWAWIGGLLGAFFVTMSVYLVPKTGATVFVSLVIAGQLFASVIIDHFGLLDIAVREFTWGRLLGLLLMGAGVTCIRLL